MKLLSIENYQIKVTDEALLVKPIRDLFNNDKSKNKEVFYTQCSVIFFMADPRSSYSYITDLEERFNEIKKQEGLPKTFKIDKELQTAIDVYKDLCRTSSSRLLEDAQVAVDKVRRFLREVDLTALDRNDKPIYTVNTITTALKAIPQLAKDLIETERIVTKELEEQGRMKGGNERKAMFEDGI